MYLTVALLFIFAAAIAIATFIESAQSTDAARAMVYGAKWFEILLALLGLNLVVSLVSGFPFRANRLGFVIAHISMIVILIGAGITRFFGYEGVMSIREGSSTDYMYSRKEHIEVQTGGQSAFIPVFLYKSGQTLHRKVSVGSQELDISIADYWPHFENLVVEGEGGVPTIKFSATGSRGMEIQTLSRGERLALPGAEARFLNGALNDSPPASPYGRLEVIFNGETRTMDVPRTPPAEMTISGYRFLISEFHPSFRVGASPSASDEMENPAIRVEIEGPDGEKGRRLLFAFHPDFDMGHAGGEASFSEIEMKYQYNSELYFSYEPGGELAGRATFSLEIRPKNPSEPPRSVAAGEDFTLAPDETIRSATFVLALMEVWRSAVTRPGLSDDESKMPASRVAVTDHAGNRAETILSHGDDLTWLDLSGHEVGIRLGAKIIKLPYTIHLDDFVLVTYPGSSNPASYESRVRVFDEEAGVNGRAERIYMNHPLTFRGYKHFQSSYDQDRRGTILSVNYDPGKTPTYIGYLFLGIGFLITLSRKLIWPKMKEE